ncbi:hypothetical protein NEMBOFW57_009348 [Staphylotrichum longicolle]|uniref:Uncharacterized protein n=1 Tax=Staphylotrichum longicolle TaxID=669026 RepID=A0AAD4ESP9_9PEZI|nr:hypothetical protein NEMBOFW57_009348 [Staphylotrichum longicolle]
MATGSHAIVLTWHEVGRVSIRNLDDGTRTERAGVYPPSGFLVVDELASTVTFILDGIDGGAPTAYPLLMDEETRAPATVLYAGASSDLDFVGIFSVDSPLFHAFFEAPSDVPGAVALAAPVVFWLEPVRFPGVEAEERGRFAPVIFEGLRAYRMWATKGSVIAVMEIDCGEG